MSHSSKVRLEIINQGEALSQLKMDTLDAIEMFAVDFRMILTDFWIEFHKVATADDLIFICSQHFDCNIRELV